MTDETNPGAGVDSNQAGKAQTQVVWDDTDLNLTYANVVNVTS